MPMAPLEYTLTTTRPPGSSTNPVDCRNSGSSLTNAPVVSAIAEASAPDPPDRKPYLAISSCVAASSSTDSATTVTSISARPSSARWNALSWALQYGHQDPR